jgi:hypothetical protein
LTSKTRESRQLTSSEKSQPMRSEIPTSSMRLFRSGLVEEKSQEGVSSLRRLFLSESDLSPASTFLSMTRGLSTLAA